MLFWPFPKENKSQKLQAQAWIAFEQSNLKDLEKAFQLGACPNTAAGSGLTITQACVQHQCYDLLPLLDQFQANWHQQLREGSTCLHVAVETGQGLWVKAMLERHINVQVKNQMGLTALHLAAKQGVSTMLMMLDQAGADWHCKDRLNKTPLDLLIQWHPHSGSSWRRRLLQRQTHTEIEEI